MSQSRMKGAAPKRKAVKPRKEIRPIRLVQRDMNPAKKTTGLIGAASAYSRPNKIVAPRIIHRTTSSWRFVKRELITTITNTNGTGFLRFPINPGMASCFPWLSQEASRWEEYKFHSLRFEYLTRSATSQTGSVILAPDYDATDPTPTTEAQITAFEDAVEDVPWRDQMCNLRPASMFPIGPRKYVRQAAVADDVKTYDVGTMFVGTVGVDTNLLGKLYVEYDIELFVPVIEATAPVATKTNVYTIAAATSYTTTVAKSLPWDAALANPLGATLSTGVITLPAGAYLIQFTGGFDDNAAEVFQASVTLFKNGVTTNFVESLASASVAGAGEHIPLSLQGLVSLNGTDTIELNVVLTGAGGALEASAHQQVLSIQVA